mgnify:CR=1 FL=1
MHIDKKLMHRIFGLIAGAIVFAWLVLDTARATAVFNYIWGLSAPFVAGAGIAGIAGVTGVAGVAGAGAAAGAGAGAL